MNDTQVGIAIVMAWASVGMGDATAQVLETCTASDVRASTDGNGTPDQRGLVCGAAAHRPTLHAPVEGYDWMGWHMDANDDTLAMTARLGQFWHVLVYDAATLEFRAALDTGAPYWTTTIVGSQVAVGDGFIVHSDTYGDENPVPVTIFESLGAGWIATKRLPLPEGAQHESGFGFGVAASGDRLAVCDFVGWGEIDGAVYVYERQGSGAWEAVQPIVSSAATPWWGAAVAMWDDWLAIGSPQGGLMSLGEVELYRFEQGQYVHHSTLSPHGPLPDGYTWGFGEHLSMDEGTLVIGAGDILNWSGHGLAEVFRWGGRRGSTREVWTHRMCLSSMCLVRTFRCEVTVCASEPPKQGLPRRADRSASTNGLSMATGNAWWQ